MCDSSDLPLESVHCSQLAARIESMQPDANPGEVARLCLMLANQTENLAEFGDDESLRHIWQQVSLKLHSSTDQHAAMTAELEALAASDPAKFSPEQIWILIRAIKVQSQILQLYVGYPVLDV